MTDLPDPCIIFALGREARAFLRDFPSRRPLPGAPCRAQFCASQRRRILVLETGVGPAAMQSALGWLFSNPVVAGVPYRPSCVISAGFSGALREDLAVGDVILATEVTDCEGRHWQVSWPGEFAPRIEPSLHRGRLLCVPRVIADPPEKRTLGQKFQALAADMETAVVARLCSDQQVPFGCLRAISDDVRRTLSPALVTLVKDGRISPWRLLAALAASPSLVVELWRLARHTRLAAESLSQALSRLL